jgi:hypothetical protein
LSGNLGRLLAVPPAGVCCAAHLDHIAHASAAALAVYYRRLALHGVWQFVQIEVFPVVSSAFLLYIVVKFVPGLGGWTSEDLTSLYVMLGIGVCLMSYGYVARTSDFFRIRREVFDPQEAAEVVVDSS